MKSEDSAGRALLGTLDDAWAPPTRKDRNRCEESFPPVRAPYGRALIGARCHRRTPTRQGFDVLALLVSERPRAIPKAELLNRVWPGKFVTDASLARTIHEIRAAIGDGSDGSPIRTVHGHGYAFVASVQEEPVAPNGAVDSQAPRPALAWLVSGPQSVPLIEGMHVAGRDRRLAFR